jgi:hypothetical protein
VASAALEIAFGAEQACVAAGARVTTISEIAPDLFRISSFLPFGRQTVGA